MHWVSFQTVDEYLAVEVYLTVVRSHFQLKVVDALVNVSLGEWMSICKDDMVVLFEGWLECVFKRHYEPFCRCLVGDCSFKARPLLAVNWHLAFLERDELFVAENKRDGGVSIAQKLALLALVDDAETGGSS